MYNVYKIYVKLNIVKERSIVINRIELKAQSRNIIRNSENPKIISVSLVFLLMLFVILILTYSISGFFEQWSEMSLQIVRGNFNDISRAAHSSSFGEQLILVALEIVLYIITAGYNIFSLNCIRHTDPCYGNLLDGFGMFARVLWLNVLESLFTLLWSLLLYIPGIIASYSYRQALFLLIDHPEMTPMQCIRESKRMMRGHKWELFVLDLSFIGWILLATLAAALMAIPVVFTSSPIVQICFSMLGAFAVFTWLYPYENITFALYYEALCKYDASFGSFSSGFDSADYTDSSDSDFPWGN